MPAQFMQKMLPGAFTRSVVPAPAVCGPQLQHKCHEQRTTRSFKLLYRHGIALNASSSKLVTHTRCRTCQRRPRHVCNSAAAVAADANSPQNGTADLTKELLDGSLFEYKRPVRAPFDDQYIAGLVWLQRQHLVTAFIAVILCTASNLASPVLTGKLVQMLVQAQPFEAYAKVFGWLALLYTVEPVLSRVYKYNMMVAGENIISMLREELFRTLLMQKIEYFDRHNASELTSLISVELDTMRNFIFNNVSRDRGVRAFMEAGGAVLVLFCLSWQLAPICSIVIIATGVAAMVYKQKTKVIESGLARQLQLMSAVASQAFDNIKTVRSFAGEPLERERFRDHVELSYAEGLKFGSAKAFFEVFNRSAIHLSLLALYAWGGYLVHTGAMQVGVLVSAIGFTYSLLFATQGIVNTLADLRRATGAFDRIRDSMQSSDPDPSMYGALPPGAWWEVANGSAAPKHESYADQAGEAAVVAAQSGDLELREVHFAYPVRPEAGVLRGVSVTLKHGTVTAIVGRSGAGKSTIANLISRFYEPQAGGIFLNNIPTNSFTRGEWAKAVAMVSQEPVLFEGTILDNIAYGCYGKCSMDEIIEAAQAANAHDFIMGLPDKYNTMVGQRGYLLSGGQRQRVAIARALLKDSPIIILDEATSALDAMSEKLVQGAVQRLVKGRTVLIIAHRLSTVQNADQIVVMKGGHVDQIGTHEQLLAQGGHYKELMSAQEMILGSTYLEPVS